MRGICCLRPGVPGVSEQHPRRSASSTASSSTAASSPSATAARPRCTCRRADWMPRNFQRRVEVMFPVEDPALQRARARRGARRSALKDNVKARRLTTDGLRAGAAAARRADGAQPDAAARARAPRRRAEGDGAGAAARGVSGGDGSGREPWAARRRAPGRRARAAARGTASDASFGGPCRATAPAPPSADAAAGAGDLAAVLEHEEHRDAADAKLDRGAQRLVETELQEGRLLARALVGEHINSERPPQGPPTAPNVDHDDGDEAVSQENASASTAWGAPLRSRSASVGPQTAVPAPSVLQLNAPTAVCIET